MWAVAVRIIHGKILILILLMLYTLRGIIWTVYSWSGKVLASELLIQTTDYRKKSSLKY
jgi:hypothetical protein